MDTAQWPQEIVVKPMEEILIPINNNNNNNTICLNSKQANNNGNENGSTERKMKPHQKAQASNCPRCNSTNTKFCYYNNYSLSQPRYFCKTCRRYWTEGGSLRNIPVGGGSRKNKKTPSTTTNSSSSKKLIPSTNTTTTTHDHNHNPKMLEQGQDLNLGYDFKTISQLIQVPNFENKSHVSALELMNGNSYMPMPIHNNVDSMYSAGYSSLPTLGFSLSGIENSGYGSIQGGVEMENNSSNIGRVLFPFEDLKQGSSTNDHNLEDNIRDQQGDSTGYWSGVLGGGSW